MPTAPRSVTVGVRNLEYALDLFHRRMDLEIDGSGDVPQDVLAAWGLPESASARYALLSRDGYRAGKLRLIQWDLATQPVVRNDLPPGATDSAFGIGPKAIDLYIPGDMDSTVTALEEAGYPLVHGPAAYTSSGLLEAMHEGPDGLSLLLMTRPDGPSGDVRPGLPPGTYGEIATISIVSGPPENNDPFYGDLLQIPKILDRAVSPQFARAVTELNGLPLDTKAHWQMFVEKDQPSAKLILIHYPEGNGKRLVGRMAPGHIGICLFSFERPDVAALAQRAEQLGFDVERPMAETSWGRIALIRGPNEDLIEVTEVQ